MQEKGGEGGMGKLIFVPDFHTRSGKQGGKMMVINKYRCLKIAMRIRPS
jgi:hypothetical protein